MARRDPTSRLNSADLPTLGRPTMAMSGSLDMNLAHRDALDRTGRPSLDGLCYFNLSDYYRESVSSSFQPASSAAPGGTLSLYKFFSPGGLLSRTHPAYEFRRGQLQMAQAVEQAIEERRHLIVEAGTGTGKTLAYLMPAIRSGKRVIISTGTKNLQEQLFYKDVPFLEKALFPDGKRALSVCYMKGRNNYLC